MSTSKVIGTRNEMMMGDYDGQMIFGDLVGLKLPDIRLTGEEKPWKKPHPGNLSRPEIEPGPAAWQARMLPLVPQQWTPPWDKYGFRVGRFWSHRPIYDIGQKWNNSKFLVFLYSLSSFSVSFLISLLPYSLLHLKSILHLLLGPNILFT